MSDTPPSPSRPVLSVLGVLVLVALVVGGAVVMAQRASDRNAAQETSDVAETSDASSPTDAPTPEGGRATDGFDDLPTIDPSDFLDETEPVPVDPDFPTAFPTDESGWQDWFENQPQEMAP